MIITGCVLALCLVLITSILIKCIFTKNHVGLEKVTFYKKTLSLILVSFQTFLFMPVLDVVIRTIFTTGLDSTFSPFSRYLLGACTLLLLSIVMFYVVRIFNICVPSELIPWCSPISNMLFLNLIVKTILVVSAATDHNGSFALYEVIVLFILQTFQGCYRLLFAPSYLKEVDVFIKTKDFTVSLIFFIGLICKILTDKQNYDAVYFIIFIPIVTVGWIQFE